MAGKKPTHTAYLVEDREAKKGYWTEIGAAWAHKDGQGFDVILKALPLDGRIVVRTRDAKTKAED